jgi:hypothetical protein
MHSRTTEWLGAGLIAVGLLGCASEAVPGSGEPPARSESALLAGTYYVCECGTSSVCVLNTTGVDLTKVSCTPGDAGGVLYSGCTPAVPNTLAACTAAASAAAGFTTSSPTQLGR